MVKKQKTTDTPVTDKVRELMLGVVIWAGKTEQKNSAMYEFYKQGAKQ